MDLRPLAILWLLLVAVPSAATDRAAVIIERLPGCGWTPFDDEAGGLSGYLDARGRIAVAPRFRMAEAFGADGLAPVLDAEGFGYLSCTGKVFHVLTYDNGPDAFREGLVRVRHEGRIGYANRRGELVIPARYGDGTSFCLGLAQVGTECISTQDGEHTLRVCKANHWIDRNGRQVPTPENPPEVGQCDVAQSTEVVERLPSCAWKLFQGPPVKEPDEAEASIYLGFRDESGKVVIEPRFSRASEFGEDGLAPVTENYRAMYLNCEGKTFDVLYDAGPDPFREGLARYESEDSTGVGFVNRRGQIVIPATHDYASPFCGGVSRIGTGCTIEHQDSQFSKVECKQWSAIDRTGTAVPEPEDRPASCAELK